MSYTIPANSHSCGLKTLISCRLTLAAQFLTPDWKMWVVAVLLHAISKNMLTPTHVRNENHVVKWINDNTFLAISDFWNENHWERACVYTHPKTGTGKCEGCFCLCHRRTSSEDFGLLQKTSECFGNIRKWSCRFQKSQHSQEKNLTPIFQKKLAGILHWYRMYVHLCTAK